MALTTEEWAEAPPHDHVVQFYDHDDELAAGVGPYLVEAIEAGGVAIVIATEAHRNAFAARLAEAGIDPVAAQNEAAAGGSGLIMLDAHEAAASLLVNGRLAPHCYDKLVGDLVREAATGGRLVRAYGEIVAVLWAEGHVRAALELEELWNGLGREVDFSLYCAYPRAWVDAGGDAFHSVCRLHSAVVGPRASLHALPPPAQALEVKATFRWSGRSPGAVRRFVGETLLAWGRTELLNDGALIATELATNAVLHARTAFTVVLSRGTDGTIRIAVRDACPGPPRPRQAGPFDGSGRGLALVKTLAAGWGTEFLPDGKVVWAELGR